MPIVAASVSPFRAAGTGQQQVLFRATNRAGATFYNHPGSGSGSTMRLIVGNQAIAGDRFTALLYPTDEYILDFAYQGEVSVQWETGDATSICMVTEYFSG